MELQDCQKGNHKLEVILSTGGAYHEYTVVRWCSICGAIVVDIDIDNRTCPGDVTEMKLPLIAKRELW